MSTTTTTSHAEKSDSVIEYFMALSSYNSSIVRLTKETGSATFTAQEKGVNTYYDKVIENYILAKNAYFKMPRDMQLELNYTIPKVKKI